MSEIFDSIFSTGSESTITIINFLYCVLIALASGVIYFFAYSFKNHSSKSMKISLALLPAIVSVVIMMVNGNIGIGVAVAGAFSLVRFRSAQGSAKDICAIFAAMCSGLIAGVGFLAYAILFSSIMGVLIAVANIVSQKSLAKTCDRVLKITIPEDLDYAEVFKPIFAMCTDYCNLMGVKTTNLGSLYKLTYNIALKKGIEEKEFIDKLRVRNGNLEISLHKQEENSNDL